jgi:AcrR family transcriptional regulator
LQAPLYRKLKPGPGLSREQVLADQRERLQGAMIALVDKAGCREVRVRPLALAAGVSTATFYKHFANTDECLASTYDAVMEAAVRRATMAPPAELDWELSLRAVVAKLMDYLGSGPRAARLALVEIYGGGSEARRRIGPAIGQLEGMLDASLANAPRTIRPPRHLIAGMTAGMLRVARLTTTTGRAAELPAQAEELSDWMLTLPSPEVLSLLVKRPGFVTSRTREPQPFPADTQSSDPRPVDDRERILRAAIKLTRSGGFAKLTTPRLRADAGVSRRRFEACFESLDDCFLQAIVMIGDDAAGRARAWSEDCQGWERRACRFILSLCAQIARDRPQAQLVFHEIFAAGRRGLSKREEIVSRTAAEFRNTVPPDRRPSSIAAEASIAATWQIAQTDIAAGRARSLPLVAPLLSYVILAPIIGPRTASLAVQAEIGTAGGRPEASGRWHPKS